MMKWLATYRAPFWLLFRQTLSDIWPEWRSISRDYFFKTALVYHLNFSGVAVRSGDAFLASFELFGAGVWSASTAWAIAVQQRLACCGVCLLRRENNDST